MFGGFFGSGFLSSSYYGGSRRSEPDYMDVKKAHFRLQSFADEGGEGANVLAELRRARKSLEAAADEADAKGEDATLEAAASSAGTAARASAGAGAGAAPAVKVDFTVCVECGLPSEHLCLQCRDAMCPLCFRTNHRAGNRKLHKTIHVSRVDASGSIIGDGTGDLVGTAAAASSSSSSSSSSAASAAEGKTGARMSDASDGKAADGDVVFSDDEDENDAVRIAARGGAGAGSVGKSGVPLANRAVAERRATLLAADSGSLPEWWSGKAIALDWFVERSRYIPLRLTHEERKFLRMLQAVVRASNYTNKVDKPASTFKRPGMRAVLATNEIAGVLCALVSATDYAKGCELMSNGTFGTNEAFFQQVLELGRRHKIRNPEKMRSSYGSLMYILQDSQTTESLEYLGFSCVRPVHTVYELLEQRGGLGVLRDSRLAIATQEIIHTGKTRDELDYLRKSKEKAFKDLLAHHSSAQLSRETLSLAISSIGDNHNFLRNNRDPCNEMIGYLTKYFHPTEIAGPTRSLAIHDGAEGSRLTHSHSAQYYYVLQSLCLWRDILDDFFKLWTLAENDLLDTAKVPYTLSETGQGLHRLQAAGRVDRTLRQIVHRVQSKAGNWVGSSVIHLGDRNVPNALMFIDKYTQVGRILAPIVICLRQLKAVKEEGRVMKFIESAYGSVQEAQVAILSDFFRLAFDGSGSDNFFEAGSCIDGRLTSAWHWCNQLPGKTFFPLFQLTGFVGFDGTDWDQ